MANPIDIHPDSAVPDEVLHPGSRQLFCHWERIRGEASAPLRSRIDLREIVRIAPWLAIIERAPGRQCFSWRLAGTGICRLWGRELTGRNALEGWHRFDHATLAKALEGVITTLQPFVARFSAQSEDGETVGIELLALPAYPDGRREPHILASFLPFREPQWSGERRLAGFELSSLRVIWTEPLPGEEARALLPAGRPNGFLRVINGGLAKG